MARTRANVLCDIWDDEDFIALPVDAQRLYLFLLSQRDLNHAGLVPLRLRRWAKKVPNGTVGALSKALATLAKAEFILFDRDTEEVLIRTFVRNDGVYKQPKVMLRMREDARLMESPMLRAAFARELRRIPLDELSDKPGGPHGDLESTRALVKRVIDELLAELEPDTLPDTLPDTPAEGYPIPPRGRARALHLPPTTIHQPPVEAQVGGGTYVSSAEPSQAPPIQRCGEAHSSSQACSRCGDLRKAEKAQQAAEAKAAKEARRQADIEARRQREAEAAAIERATPEQVQAAIAMVRAAVKESA